MTGTLAKIKFIQAMVKYLQPGALKAVLPVATIAAHKVGTGDRISMGVYALDKGGFVQYTLTDVRIEPGAPGVVKAYDILSTESILSRRRMTFAYAMRKWGLDIHACPSHKQAIEMYAMLQREFTPYSAQKIVNWGEITYADADRLAKRYLLNVRRCFWQPLDGYAVKQVSWQRSVRMHPGHPVFDIHPDMLSREWTKHIDI